MVTAWNKGLTYADDPRIPRPWLGKKRSKETIEKIRIANSVEEVASCVDQIERVLGVVTIE